MHKKHKHKYLSILIITSCTLAILLSVVLIEANNSTNIVVKDLLASLNKLTIPSFTTAENKSQTESYLIQKNINEELEKEITDLKKVLKLNSSLSEYSIENAKVLSRNKSYWLNTIIIDKGTKNNLKKNMAVITSEGLIGIISKAYKNSSEIKLITSNKTNNKISVSIQVDNLDTYGILNGYDQKNKLIKVEEVDKSANIKIGDTVKTSGLSKYIPKGIYIGKVEKIETDKYNLNKNLYVKTNQEFNNIHYVTVLKEKK